ncbi:hypothetical protein CUJ84_pRLN1000179 (plasmid) [Rhizobium leguminosarum]|uniref:Uncharacterized protein n=1 Tax=Rhizobium leguminosarum TaxID=384 RepID=A0A2K9ZBM1_RHILE|nr:hypothetical protein CUJ84_pRLN1000179 [Rhizobium leguminosarum]
MQLCGLGSRSATSRTTPEVPVARLDRVAFELALSVAQKDFVALFKREDHFKISRRNSGCAA